MSMEAIERYLQELEAIKNYTQVKLDKERLSQEVEELKVNLSDALKEVSSLKESKAKLDDAEMTLEEARLDFVRSQDAEIEKRMVDRFEKLKADYESQMPQLVYRRLCEILNQQWLPKDIAELVKTEAQKRADAILHDQNRWPEWFRQIYEGAVEKKVSDGLNREFDSRVETAANTRAQKKLKELINSKWPAWLQANIAPKIADLESKIYSGVFDLLRGPWTLTCDRCTTSTGIELTLEEIEQMLRTGQLRVACVNPACDDSGLFSTHRHTFLVSLRDLIKTYILR
jgi:hypothetical protein